MSAPLSGSAGRSEPALTPEVVARHGLTEAEYAVVLEFLGRRPNLTELGIFSVMWSEHCSYKSSQASGSRSCRPAGRR